MKGDCSNRQCWGSPDLGVELSGHRVIEMESRGSTSCRVVGHEVWEREEGADLC